MSSAETAKSPLPRLRFPEFRDAGPWEVKRLGEVVDVLPGYGFPDKYQGKNEGKFPFYKVSDISNALAAGSYFIDVATNYVDDDDLVALRAKTVPSGATIFAKIGEAIRSNRRAMTTRECVIDNNTAAIKAKGGQANDFFLFYLFSKVALIDYSGGVVPSVNKSAIENIKISRPDLPEQQKIADCLTSLDDLIRAEGERLAALEAHKKGLMQQLFPAEGETTPRLRFPEFRDAGPWEVKRLGEISDCYQPETISVSSTSGHGEFPVYGANGVIGYFSRYNHEEPEVIVGCRGQCGNVFLTPSKSWITGNSMVIQAEQYQVASKKFLFYSLTSSDLSYLITGSAQPQITSEIKRHRIALPDPQEQQKIADCLTSLDDLIRAEGERLTALQRHKKGLMQQLFPQEVG